MVSPSREHSGRWRKIHKRRRMGHRADEWTRRYPDLAGKTGAEYRHDLNVELHVVADDALSAAGLGIEPVENIKRIHAFRKRPFQ